MNYQSLIIFISLISNLAFGSEITVKIPTGWTQNRNYLGLDYVLFTPYKPNRQQPILYINTVQSEIKRGNGMQFLLEEVNKQKQSKLLSKGLVNAHGQKVSYIKTMISRDNETFMELFAVIPNKNKYHLIVFSSPKDYYDEYASDVSQILSSIKIQ